MKTLKRKRKTAADIPVVGEEPHEDDQTIDKGDVQTSLDENVSDPSEAIPDEPTTQKAIEEGGSVLAGSDQPTETETPDDANETAKDLERHELWKAEVRKRNSHLENLKEQRKNISAEIKDAEKELKEAILIGPEGMFNRPLLDLAERDQVNDAEIWRQMPVSGLDLPEKLKAKAEGQFHNVGQLVDWLNLSHRPKKDGIGPKAIEKLQDAVNKIHEPILQAELAQVAADEQSEELNDDVQDDIPDWVQYREIIIEMLEDERYDFAEDQIVHAMCTLGDILDWITDNEHITDDQITAVNNIKESKE